MLGLLELFGSGLGTFIAGFILDAKNVVATPNSTVTIETEEFVYNGFTSAYTIASILIVGCILQIVFFVKDTKPPSKNRLTLPELLATERTKESMRTVFKKREDNSRNIILALCLAYFFMAINYGGIFISGSLWLYFQKLGWEYVQFTTYLGVLR